MRNRLKCAVFAVVSLVTLSLGVTPAIADDSLPAGAAYTTQSTKTAKAGAQSAKGQGLATDHISDADVADPVEALASAKVPHGYDVQKAIKAAEAEIGMSFPTGVAQPGECIMSANRWVRAGGGNWQTHGNPVTNYENAQRMALSAAEPGDVIQYENIESPTSWLVGVHTVFIVGVNEDGTFQIIEANNPGGSGKVSRNNHWVPKPPPGFRAAVWRF